MNSTFGKYATPTDAKRNGREEQYKASGESQGDYFHEKSPQWSGKKEGESRNPIHSDIGMPATPQRQQDDEEEKARERARREEEESLELARALMAEEAMASYAQSMDYLTNNQDQFSEEDLAALQAAMDEEQQQHEIEINAEVEEALDDEENGDSYEFMLRLGERIGDVKSERWAHVAQQKIDSLNVVEYDPENIERKKDINDCDVKCLVCQEDYCKGDHLRQLPCGHCFHKECVDQWLLSKDFCPYCRTTLE